MESSPLNAFLVGVASGMRAFAGLTLVSQKFSSEKVTAFADGPLSFLASPKTASVMKLLAAGEVLGDKLPNAADRTEPASLAFRVAAGATSAALLSKSQGHSPAMGAFLGAAGALAGTFTFFHLRRFLNHDENIPDPLLAVIEDTITYAVGWQVVK